MTAPVLRPCPFCGGPTDRPVRWWGDVQTFTPLGPPTAGKRGAPPLIAGHVLVVPREHVPDARTNPDVTAEVFKVAALVAREIGPCNIITNVGAAATQTVFHFHVHVVPRHRGDGLKLPWTDLS